VFYGCCGFFFCRLSLESEKKNGQEKTPSRLLPPQLKVLSPCLAVAK